MLSESLTWGSEFKVESAAKLPEGFLDYVAEINNVPEDIFYTNAGVEVDVPSEMERLARADTRKDHTRTRDAVIQSFMDEFDNRSYDMILSEIPYSHTPYTSPHLDEDDPMVENRVQKGDIDVATIDFDNRIFRAYEIKPHRGLPIDRNGNPIISDDVETHKEKAERQLERLSDTFDYLNEQDDFDWEFEGWTFFAKDLGPEYFVPDPVRGQYFAGENGVGAACGYESFSELNRYLLGDGLDLDEENEMKSGSPDLLRKF